MCLLDEPEIEMELPAGADADSFLCMRDRIRLDHRLRCVAGYDDRIPGGTFLVIGPPRAVLALIPGLLERYELQQRREREWRDMQNVAAHGSMIQQRALQNVAGLGGLGGPNQYAMNARQALEPFLPILGVEPDRRQDLIDYGWALGFDVRSLLR